MAGQNPFPSGIFAPDLDVSVLEAEGWAAGADLAAGLHEAAEVGPAGGAAASVRSDEECPGFHGDAGGGVSFELAGGVVALALYVLHG